MTLQQVIDELKNIKEQATNDEEIGKNSVLDMDFDDDHYGSFEETDFSSLADID